MTAWTEDAPLFAVVMAGGSGTRFWPLSRRHRPKQLLPFAAGQSLLKSTVERLQHLVPVERIQVVTVAAVAEATRRELPEVPAANILVEPVGRDTAACLGWTAWRLAAKHPDAVMVVVPADHVIPDQAALSRTLAAAAAVARERNGLVTLGVRPTRPETGFGYLELGEREEERAGVAVHRVRRFVEKPDLARAEAMVRAGNFRWNAGMFAWRAAVLQEQIRRHLPDLAAGLDRLVADALSDGEPAALARHYPELPRTSIDFGVMEKAEDVWAVAAEFAWCDVGSWNGLAEVLPAGEAGVSLGDVIALDTGNCVLVSDGPVVAAVGVHDLVVVATGDAVLVAHRDQAQRIKELVGELQRRGRDEVL